MDKKLSVIIPVYNTSKFLEECLNSVINQTYKNLEIIVVNDCSTDNSLDILYKYLNNDKRIKVINNEENLGLFRTRVIGSKFATGDYITFLDSDDYLSIDYYRNMLNETVNESVDIVIGRIVLNYSDSIKEFLNIQNIYYTKLYEDDVASEFFKQHGQDFLWHTVWNKIYSFKLWKKCLKTFEKINIHLNYFEDFLFTSILFCNANSLKLCNKDNVFYRKHNSALTYSFNLSYDQLLKQTNDIIYAMKFVEKYLEQNRKYTKNLKYLKEWKKTQKNYLYSNLNNSLLNEEDKKKIMIIIDEYFFENIEDFEFIERHFIKYNDYFEKAKIKIANEDIKKIYIDLDILFFDCFDMFSGICNEKEYSYFIMRQEINELYDLTVYLNKEVIIVHNLDSIDINSILEKEQYILYKNNKLVNKKNVNIEDNFLYITSDYKMKGSNILFFDYNILGIVPRVINYIIRILLSFIKLVSKKYWLKLVLAINVVGNTTISRSKYMVYDRINYKSLDNMIYIVKKYNIPYLSEKKDSKFIKFAFYLLSERDYYIQKLAVSMSKYPLLYRFCRKNYRFFKKLLVKYK